MHVWRAAGEGTVGCTAMPKEDVEQLIQWLDPAKSPRLVQLPLGQYNKLRKHLASFRLPPAQ